MQSIISTTAPMYQSLTHDWYGTPALAPVKYSFALQDAYLVFRAAQSAPVVIHPAARPGVFTENLWQYDTAEFFIADEAGQNYIEFNLCPNGAWWACAFDAPRRVLRRTGAPEGVQTQGKVTPQGWQAEAHLPLAWLRSVGIDINRCRIAAACILNSPDYLFYTTANDTSGTPDFHRPRSWPMATFR